MISINNPTFINQEYIEREFKRTITCDVVDAWPMALEKLGRYELASECRKMKAEGKKKLREGFITKNGIKMTDMYSIWLSYVNTFVNVNQIDLKDIKSYFYDEVTFNCHEDKEKRLKMNIKVDGQNISFIKKAI